MTKTCNLVRENLRLERRLPFGRRSIELPAIMVFMRSSTLMTSRRLPKVQGDLYPPYKTWGSH